MVIGGDINNAYGRTIVERAKGCKNIIFPGIVYGDAKIALLKNCMAYCLVSSSEGLPIALLEGMSYGNYTWPQICDRYIELVKEF